MREVAVLRHVARLPDRGVGERRVHRQRGQARATRGAGWSASRTCCASDGVRGGPGARRARRRSRRAHARCAAREPRPPRFPPPAPRQRRHAPSARAAGVRSAVASRAPRSERNTESLCDSERKEGVSGGLLRLRASISSAVSAPARVVRGACPHDCPDTCALLVEVDAAGRAIAVKGDPRSPRHGGLPVRQGVELPRARVLATSASSTRSCARARRARAASAGSSWDEALEVAARGLRDASERHGGASIVPYSYLGTQGVLQGDVMGDRLLDALGGSTLVRTICASAGAAGTMATNGASPEVDPEEWVHARTIVVWGWNPLSTAPHLWRFILEARRRGARLIVDRSLPQPHGARRRLHLQPLPGTDGALALGIMRALLDAGLADEEWCRAHALGYDELVERLESETRRAAAPRAAASPAGRSARARARAGAGPAVADPPRRRRAAPRRRADRVPHDRLHPGAGRLVAASRRRPLVHPDGHVRRARRGPARAAAPARGPGALAQHVAHRRGADRPGARPARRGADRVELEPGGDRARPGAGARGPARATTSSRSCASSS